MVFLHFRSSLSYYFSNRNLTFRHILLKTIYNIVYEYVLGTLIFFWNSHFYIDILQCILNIFEKYWIDLEILDKLNISFMIF